MKKILLICAFSLAATLAMADSFDPYKPAPSAPKSDFQRALDNPIRPPPPPTALQKLERGEIPSYRNPMPPPREGVSVGTGGVQYRKTFK
ncbi:hypothetical protein D3C71_1395020 [compost metagenome]